MSYQALARKWRPQTFAGVAGQEHVLTVLANGLLLGCIHHAYLFSSTRGVGKTSTARLLAKGLDYEAGITATPYGVCNNCYEIEQGRFVDLIEINATSHTEVEDTHDLLDNVQYAPARGCFKVYLIDEVHMLSRHSSNALLKTPEEPPEHVESLLAATGPQKLPVTVLPRCLQFHLKALGIEQIRHQLEHILNEEHITHEPRVLQLLARAAEGSLQNVLSLTDQAIASGGGQVSTQAVSAMLGTLGDDQALSLVEVMVEADGECVMTLINEATAHGIEWGALLVEMLGLSHRIVMVQPSPTALGNDMAAIELRMRELARTIPLTDIQLYYQTLLIDHEESPYAPGRRMGVEMTLLHTLVFRPRVPLLEPGVSRQSFASVTLTTVMTLTQVPPQPQSAPRQAPTVPFPETISRVLAARQQLQHMQGTAKAEKSELATATRARLVNNATLERLASVTDRVQAHPVPSTLEKTPARKEAYYWKVTTPVMQQKEVVAAPKALKKALEHEKTSELAAKLAAEAIEHDPWAAQMSRLSLPKLVKQVALNVWKEESDDAVCLHLRSSRRHLNNRGTQQKLTGTLSTLESSTVELTIAEDDNPAARTPLEWRQAIYGEKLAQARESITADNNIQTLHRFFDTKLDEESIRPIWSQAQLTFVILNMIEKETYVW